jgi:hypothetical protein
VVNSPPAQPDNPNPNPNSNSYPFPKPSVKAEEGSPPDNPNPYPKPSVRGDERLPGSGKPSPFPKPNSPDTIPNPGDPDFYPKPEHNPHTSTPRPPPNTTPTTTLSLLFQIPGQLVKDTDEEMAKGFAGSLEPLVDSNSDVVRARKANNVNTDRFSASAVAKHTQEPSTLSHNEDTLQRSFQPKTRSTGILSKLLLPRDKHVLTHHALRRESRLPVSIGKLLSKPSATSENLSASASPLEQPHPTIDNSEPYSSAHSGPSEMFVTPNSIADSTPTSILQESTVAVAESGADLSDDASQPRKLLSRPFSASLGASQPRPSGVGSARSTKSRETSSGTAREASSVVHTTPESKSSSSDPSSDREEVDTDFTPNVSGQNLTNNRSEDDAHFQPDAVSSVIGNESSTTTRNSEGYLLSKPFLALPVEGNIESLGAEPAPSPFESHVLFDVFGTAWKVLGRQTNGSSPPDDANTSREEEGAGESDVSVKSKEATARNDVSIESSTAWYSSDDGDGSYNSEDSWNSYYDSYSSWDAPDEEGYNSYYDSNSSYDSSEYSDSSYSSSYWSDQYYDDSESSSYYLGEISSTKTTDNVSSARVSLSVDSKSEPNSSTVISSILRSSSSPIATTPVPVHSTATLEKVSRLTKGMADNESTSNQIKISDDYKASNISETVTKSTRNDGTINYQYSFTKSFSNHNENMKINNLKKERHVENHNVHNATGNRDLAADTDNGRLSTSADTRQSNLNIQMTQEQRSRREIGDEAGTADKIRNKITAGLTESYARQINDENVTQRQNLDKFESGENSFSHAETLEKVHVQSGISKGEDLSVGVYGEKERDGQRTARDVYAAETVGNIYVHKDTDEEDEQGRRDEYYVPIVEMMKRALKKLMKNDNLVTVGEPEDAAAAYKVR